MTRGWVTSGKAAGDARFMDVLREHNAIIRKQVKAHGGFEVKSEGDGFIVAFQSAGKALACAAAIQKALLARNDSAAEPVRVRTLYLWSDGQPGLRYYGQGIKNDPAPTWNLCGVDGEAPLQTKFWFQTVPDEIERAAADGVTIAGTYNSDMSHYSETYTWDLHQAPPEP
jgi:hypothetical protein